MRSPSHSHRLSAVSCVAALAVAGCGMVGPRHAKAARSTLCTVGFTQASAVIVVRGPGAARVCRSSIATKPLAVIGRGFALHTDPDSPILCRVRDRRSGNTVWIEDTTSNDPIGSALCRLVERAAATPSTAINGAPAHRNYLASLASAASGAHPVNGITCAAPPRLTYHWHAHVAIYVDGTLRSIPAGVGIGTPRQSISGATEGPCTYPVHTHTPDGILHIESPTSRLYTLGTFFAVWHQPLSPTRVGPVRGPVTVLVNGKPYHGSPAGVVLREHELIQLDVGTPAVPFRSFTFPSGL